MKMIQKQLHFILVLMHVVFMLKILIMVQIIQHLGQSKHSIRVFWGHGITEIMLTRVILVS